MKPLQKRSKLAILAAICALRAQDRLFGLQKDEYGALIALENEIAFRKLI
jgi:hypothetical protein